MDYIVSDIIDCAYCDGESRDNRFKILDNVQYALMRKYKNYGRDDYFCAHCVVRITAKLQKRTEKKRQRRNRSPHGTTVETRDMIDSQEIGQNSNESDDSQVHRRRHVEPNESSKTGSTSSASVNVPRRSTTQRDATAQADQNHPQPSTSGQMAPPATRQRNFVAKSTGGRMGRPQQSSAPRNTTAQSTSTTTNSRPGPLSSKNKTNTQNETPVDSSSSEVVPPYGNLPSPISNANSGSHSEVSNSPLPSPNVRDSFSTHVEGPKAPMPRNRSERNREPQNVSPRRRGESEDAFRKRMQGAHRTFHRGDGG